MELFIIGFIVAANIIFILIKLGKERYTDASLDATLLVIITIVFGGSYASLVVGTVASLVISIYLYANPPDISRLKPAGKQDLDLGEFISELQSRTKRRY